MQPADHPSPDERRSGIDRRSGGDRRGAHDDRVRAGPAPAVVELVRLGIVLALTAGGFALAPTIDELLPMEPPPDAESVRLVTSVLGALLGYVIGGVAGRALLMGVDVAESRLRRIEAVVLIAGLLGAAVSGVLGAVVLLPLLLLPWRAVTIPVSLAALAVLLYAGARLGAARGGDLLRFVGGRGRIEVSTPSRGTTTKLVDTSALIDGRLVELARAGFVDGTLVIPRFVLDELQSLADTEDPRRRNAGRRGLDTLQVLQDERLLGVEVTDDDAPAFQDVDAKLAALARERGASLLTVDANLARVAEVSGVRVLNLHVLAEAMRPPVIPGDRVTIAITKEGREQGQGVGYLPDGTMVVVERAVDHVGDTIEAEVTSLLQTRNGRMVFAALADGSQG